MEDVSCQPQLVRLQYFENANFGFSQWASFKDCKNTKILVLIDGNFCCSLEKIFMTAAEIFYAVLLSAVLLFLLIGLN